MIREGLSAFRGKRVLLLQGPLGPFFRRLARDLRSVGATVTKVNFNGGDWLFYPAGAIAFRGTAESWPGFFENLLAERRIDVVMLMGDCRPMHRIAHTICERHGVEVGVFEEGYVRPDYVTLERSGVNANSLIPRDPEFYRGMPDTAIVPPLKVGHAFWYAAAWAMMYYLAAAILKPIFRSYRHHRPLTILEGLPWLRSFWRKAYYARKEKGIESMLVEHYSKRFFLVPLQVHNDAQIHTHSDFASVEDFIRIQVESFAAHAPQDTLLVIKHHPMDRGYHDYGRFVARLARANNLSGRVICIHDQHLPTLLDHARGVIVINSTVGLSALHHGCPLKVCGSALYDMERLSYQGSLDDFWRDSASVAVDAELFRRFLSYMIVRTQLNGNFYKRIDSEKRKLCVGWSMQPTVPDEVTKPGYEYGKAAASSRL